MDDDDEMRLLVAAMLRVRLGVEVVGEGANGDEAVELSAKLRPDLLVLDHVMPVRLGGDAVADIREASPETCIVMFSATTTTSELRDGGYVPDRFVSKAEGLVGLHGAVVDCLAELEDQRAGRRPRQPDFPPAVER